MADQDDHDVNQTDQPEPNRLYTNVGRSKRPILTPEEIEKIQHDLWMQSMTARLKMAREKRRKQRKREK